MATADKHNKLLEKIVIIFAGIDSSKFWRKHKYLANQTKRDPILCTVGWASVPFIIFNFGFYSLTIPFWKFNFASINFICVSS